MATRTIIEPFRIKSVEPLRWTTREQRENLLRTAHYNLFLLKAEDVLIEPAHGFGHRRNVHAPMGGDDGGR